MEGTDPVTPLPVPYSYLVLHKLKRWDECHTSAVALGALNSHEDHSTRVALKELRSLIKALRQSNKSILHHDPNFDPKLHNESAARVERFLAAYKNNYIKEWRQMGLLGGLEVNTSTTATSALVPERPLKPKWNNLSHMHIRWLAAQTTVDILTELGLPCAIFGSMACKLYGNERLPNDVDILVLPPPERASITQEEIKALIVQHAPFNYHFVLKSARNPQATYTVLHFVAKPHPSRSLSSDFVKRIFTSMGLDDFTKSDTTSQRFQSTAVRIPHHISSKVDILLPGVMHLPVLPPSITTQQYSLPLVPFPVLILQKLQGWIDHRAATEARYRAKIGIDARDLQWCISQEAVQLHLSKYKNHSSPKEPWKRMWSDRRMFSAEFEELSRMRVREFCEVYEGLKETWRAIGFDV